MANATILEAKTTLSELIKKAQQGEEIIITSGPDRTPVARIEAIHPIGKKRLGAMETPGFTLTAGFFDPMPKEDL